MFQGIGFDLNKSRTTPVSVDDDSAEKLAEFKNLVEFLKVMKRHGIFNEGSIPGKVLLADSVHLNQHVMKRHF